MAGRRFDDCRRCALNVMLGKQQQAFKKNMTVFIPYSGMIYKPIKAFDDALPTAAKE